MDTAKTKKRLPLLGVFCFLSFMENFGGNRFGQEIEECLGRRENCGESDAAYAENYDYFSCLIKPILVLDNVVV